MVKPRIKLYGFEVHDRNYESCRVREQLWNSKEKLADYLKADGWRHVAVMAGEYLVMDDCWVRKDDKNLDPDEMLFDISVLKQNSVYGFVREFYYGPE